jgi:ABC-type uncharacterized transport system auxiliary subunit
MKRVSGAFIMDLVRFRDRGLLTIGVTLIAAFSGCSIISPTARPEPDAYLLSLERKADFDLPVSSSTSDDTKALIQARVMIEQEGGAPIGITSRVLFITDKQTLGSYQYAQWAEPPATVFQRALLERLSEGKRLADVTTSAGLVATDRIVRFRIDSFWLNNFEGSPSKAQAEMTVTIIDLEGRKTIGRETFSEQVPVTDPSAETTVRALTEAGRRIVERTIEYIYGTLEAYEQKGKRE